MKRYKLAIKGDIYFQNEILNYYSVDSSSYQIKPKMVVMPKTIEDIKKIIKFAKKHNLSIIPRGAGTGLVGGSLGNGIIVDMKNFKKIKVFKNFLKIESGVYKGELDNVLKKYKKFLSPNPSVGPYCTLGGMIGTNASGSKALKYGSIIDNLLEVTIITGDGKTVTLPNNKNFSKKIYKISKNAQLDRFPNVTKNSSGYRLDKIRNENHSHKIIAGSEGTLGIVVSAKIKLYQIPAKRHLAVIAYHKQNFATDCKNIIKLKPAALEFVDKNTLQNIPYNFPKGTKALLLVEFDSKIKSSFNKLKKIIFGNIVFSTSNTSNIERWWQYRDQALSYSIKKITKTKIAPHIIEDAVLPISKIEKLFELISSLSKFKVQKIVYGHAGNANLHVRLILKSNKKSLIKKITKFYFSKIIENGGSISGEHGDGIARTEYIMMQYGPKNYSQFQKIKELFDPYNLMNPNKIVIST